MMVSELGEFGLIQLLSEILGPAPLAKADCSGLLVDIGDDTAIWRPEDSVELATTDTMVEGVHFRLTTTSWRDLGWKAIAINLSDIAAMGTVPQYALVSLGLSPETEVDSVADLYRGMADICREYGCWVIGGDTVSSPCTMINVTLTGRALGEITYPENVLRRSEAKVGDKIAVTGFLGNSGAGLRMLSNNMHLAESTAQSLAQAHNKPTPRVAEGQALVKAGVRAAMDLSDGLMADLPKLCRESRTAARVYIDRLPISPALGEAFGPEALDLALTGGEDYELIFSGSQQALQLASEAFSTPATIIGEMAEGEPGQVTLIDKSGQVVEWPKSGWEHFTSS